MVEARDKDISVVTASYLGLASIRPGDLLRRLRFRGYGSAWANAIQIPPPSNLGWKERRDNPLDRDQEQQAGRSRRVSRLRAGVKCVPSAGQGRLHRPVSFPVSFLLSLSPRERSPQ